MRDLQPNSVDSVVCDPPYHLTSIVKRFGKSHLEGAAHKDQSKIKAAQYGRLSKGFMGQQWDGGDVAFQPHTWAEVLRVLKPGGHIVAFSGTRTYHRMACAIEDAGFEIRDQLAWVYGSGFPKSHDAGDGWGTALKPAWEPICFGRKPVVGTVARNRDELGTGAINIDGCRIATDEDLRAGTGNTPCRHDPDVARGREGEASANRRYRDSGAVQFTGKPGPRGGDAKGRWPANFIHDGSDEVVAQFPAEAGTSGKASGSTLRGGNTSVARGRFNGLPDDVEPAFYGDSGSAARFFYCAKADAADRGEGNNHPTVKPQALMRWLVRLVTPVGGTVLDPFMGSGSTGIAADAEQFNFIGCELSPEFAAIAERRIRNAAGLFADVCAA